MFILPARAPVLFPSIQNDRVSEAEDFVFYDSESQTANNYFYLCGSSQIYETISPLLSLFPAQQALLLPAQFQFPARAGRCYQGGEADKTCCVLYARKKTFCSSRQGLSRSLDTNEAKYRVSIAT